MADNTNPCLQAALAYATQSELPLYVFPAPPGKKKSYFRKQYADDKNWRMTNNPDTIEKYWRQRPNANVCIATGEINGIFVIETDTKEGHPDIAVDGEESLAKLVADHGGEWPETLKAESPTGSIHYYFRYPDGDNITIKGGDNKLGTGIDVLGDGNMVVAPPSVRSLKDDRRYKWINKPHGIANAPQWLCDLVIEKDYIHEFGNPQAPIGKIAEAMRIIPNTDAKVTWDITDDTTGEVLKTLTGWKGWNIIMMAQYRATGGSDQGFAIANSWCKQHPTYKENYTRDTWYRRYVKNPPESLGAGTLFKIANEYEAGWQLIWNEQHPEEWAAWEKEHPDGDSDAETSTQQKNPSSSNTAKEEKSAANDKATGETDDWCDPVDLWSKFDLPELPTGLLPVDIENYARIEGENKGCDAAGLAMAALTICAATISDTIRLQVKEHDEYWTEPARVWAALVGDPSAKKSPILSQAAWPIAMLDRKLTAQYLAEKETYDELSAADRKNNPPPKHPRLKIEDATIEAAQEILKDSPDGALLLLDELSGFFGTIDKYSGSKGSGADRAFWMKSYNGGPSSFHRIARGSRLDSKSFSMPARRYST